MAARTGETTHSETAETGELTVFKYASFICGCAILLLGMLFLPRVNKAPLIASSLSFVDTPRTELAPYPRYQVDATVKEVFLDSVNDNTQEYPKDYVSLVIERVTTLPSQVTPSSAELRPDQTVLVHARYSAREATLRRPIASPTPATSHSPDTAVSNTPELPQYENGTFVYVINEIDLATTSSNTLPGLKAGDRITTQVEVTGTGLYEIGSYQYIK